MRRIVIILLAAGLTACGGTPAAGTPAGYTPTPTSAGYTIGAELQPGTYSSQVFNTPTQFTVPAGWKVFEDQSGQFGLAIVANDGPCICFWRDVSLMSATCAESPEPGVETTAEAIAHGLANRPGILASEITPVNVGGLSGVRIDVRLDPTWTGTCPFSPGNPTVPTLVGTGISRGVAWGVDGGSSQRLYLLNLDPASGGSNLAINVEVCCGVEFDERTQVVAPVIESLVFGT